MIQRDVPCNRAAYDGGAKSWLEVYIVQAHSDEAYLEVSAGDQTG